MTYIIHTDGGSRQNPGPAATGIVIEKGDKKITFGNYLGEATNNVAEYTAVLEALEYVLNKFPGEKEDISFILDSELVVKQLRGEYQIRDTKLQILAKQIKDKITEWGSTVTFSHVKRNENKEADRIVNDTLDEYEL